MTDILNAVAWWLNGAADSMTEAAFARCGVVRAVLIDLANGADRLAGAIHTPEPAP